METADESCRLLVEEMREGALTLTGTGDILYCNARLAELLDSKPAKVIGGSLQRFIAGSEWPAVIGMISGESKGEVGVQTATGQRVPAHLSFSAMRGGDLNGVGLAALLMIAATCCWSRTMHPSPR